MPAPEGNKNAVGNEGGRPALYTDPIVLEKKIEEYFNGGANERTIVIGKGELKQAVKIPIITITGLCYFLGFESRQSFYDYENIVEFSYIIKKARLRVEQHYEEMLQLDFSPASPIFALKNMNWHDKQETEHSGEIKTSNISNLSTEELIKRAEAAKSIEKK